jgi:hypothetical protein
MIAEPASPGESLVLDAHDLECDESALTGEACRRRNHLRRAGWA